MAPEAPASPNRLALVIIGVLLSFASAVGTVLLFEVADTSIRGRRDIEALIAVPPLAVLPWIETPAERASKTKVRRLSFAGAATSVVVAIVMVHLLYRPLDVLWAVAWRRFFG
jgi:hypothetical protein